MAYSDYVKIRPVLMNGMSINYIGKNSATDHEMAIADGMVAIRS